MRIFWNTCRMFLLMMLITGVFYPLLITAIAQLTMKQKADGDLIIHEGNVIGARLIAQKFESDKYFWPRPSAVEYNPLASGGSNLGPTSAALKSVVDDRRLAIIKAHPAEMPIIPTDLLFASGSGLDPHIHVSTAYFQLERVAKVRGFDEKGTKDLTNLIHTLAHERQFGVLVERYVNVLILNINLDDLEKKIKKSSSNTQKKAK